MVLVLALAAGLWGLGYLAGASRTARWVSVLVLLAGVVLSHLVLPDGNPLREATGGSAAMWLILPASKSREISRAPATPTAAQRRHRG